ncbi:MAG: histidine kinase [Thermodesulfobacteriota bacterium]|nr:histidine kinase [Thermodesulfobacteriota bacterium]
MKSENKTTKQTVKDVMKLPNRVLELDASETEDRRAEEELIRHLTLVLRAIQNVNKLIIKEKDKGRLIKGICENLVETRGYYNAWIALLDESGTLETAAEAGLGDEFQLMARMLKRGKLTICARKALEQPDVLVIADPLSICVDCPMARKYYGRAGMTVRLDYEGRLYGLLSVSIQSHIADDEQEQFLFKDLASTVSFALHNLEVEEVRRQAEKQVHALSLKVEEAHEIERKLVAQEIHDSIGASLVAIKYCLEETLDIMSERQAAEVKLLEKTISMIQTTIEESRRISTNLRPAMLDDLGILATIDWLCGGFQEVYSGIQIEKQIHVQENEVPEYLKIVIFRILQEVLNNIAKHSAADFVRLSLAKRACNIKLCVEDNGQGFDLMQVLSDKNYTIGIGLASMKERTELSGGVMNIQAKQGVGTTIVASWPLK